jgi:hypothetical protein
MGLVTIALVIVGCWIGVVFVVLAMCKASGHADAETDAERYLAEGRGEVSNQSLEPDSNATVSDERKSVDRAELERAAQRLRIELPERPHVRRTRPAGIRRHR